MLVVEYVGPCTRYDFDELKIAALFFDKIRVDAHIRAIIETYPAKNDGEEPRLKFKGIQEFVTDEFVVNIEDLRKEGVVELYDSDRSAVESKHNSEQFKNLIQSTYSEGRRLNIESFFTTDAHQIFFNSRPEIERDAHGRIQKVSISSSDEIVNVLESFHNKSAEPHQTWGDLKFLIDFYIEHFSSLISHMSTGVPSLTSSGIINNFLRYYYQDEKIKHHWKENSMQGVIPNLAYETIKLAVPNISAFPVDEVLEVRLKAQDELLNFKRELEIFQFNLLENYDFAEINSKSHELVKFKLEPRLHDLIRKIENLNLSLPKKALEQFKDPRSYSPLIGSVFGGLPVHITTLLSLGLITASTAYDYYLNNKEIKNNGLNYLIKLNSKFGKT